MNIQIDMAHYANWAYKNYNFTFKAYADTGLSNYKTIDLISWFIPHLEIYREEDPCFDYSEYFIGVHKIKYLFSIKSFSIKQARKILRIPFLKDVKLNRFYSRDPIDTIMEAYDSQDGIRYSSNIAEYITANTLDHIAVLYDRLSRSIQVGELMSILESEE